MNDTFSVGSRLRHPKMSDWGIGQVTSVESSTVTIFFESVGEKKIRTDIISLIPIEGSEAESSPLDSKFRKKGVSRRRFVGSKYFNDGKSASRKQFIERLGGECANWIWSWSFVNRDKRKVFFGAWQDMSEGNRSLIFSGSWKMKHGKNRPSWPESRENLRLIEEEGYSLYVYTMIVDPDSELDYEKGSRKIGAILNDLSEATLIRENDEWYAVFPETDDDLLP
ncbi:MAG TPA: DUF3553 domain-containing protein [Pyrinomonadaceae bacterium]|nr:DUF3553 domain-containing protein [Pyrinomonadaceae bacterium]